MRTETSGAIGVGLGDGGRVGTQFCESTWAISILPQIDQAPLFNLLSGVSGKRMDAIPESSQAMSTACNAAIPAYSCPSDPHAGKNSSVWGLADSNDGICINYAGCHGTVAVTSSNYSNPAQMNGMFFGLSGLDTADVGDGLSNTLMVGEIGLALDKASVTAPERDWHGRLYRGSWVGVLYNASLPPNTRTPDQMIRCQTTATDPFVPCNTNQGSTNIMYSRSHHVGGAHQLMGDGSVQFMSSNINTSMFGYFGTRQGSEAVSFQ